MWISTVNKIRNVLVLVVYLLYQNRTTMTIRMIAKDNDGKLLSYIFGASDPMRIKKHWEEIYGKKLNRIEIYYIYN